MKNGTSRGLRFLSIGDPHFRDKHLLRAEEMMNSIISIATDLANKNAIDEIVNLGDTFHTFRLVDQYCQELAIRFCRRLAAIRPLKIIIGNHDRPSHNEFLTNRHPFHGLECDKNITIVWRSYAEWREEVNGYIVWMPYIQKGKHDEALRRIVFHHTDKNDNNLPHNDPHESSIKQGTVHATNEHCFSGPTPYDIIMGHSHDNALQNSANNSANNSSKNPLHVNINDSVSHTDINTLIAVEFSHGEYRGAWMNGHQSKTGDVWTTNMWPNVSGHIHDHQYIGLTNVVGDQVEVCGVVYVGTPIQVAMNEAEDKTISIITVPHITTGTRRVIYEKRIPLMCTLTKTIRLNYDDMLNWDQSNMPLDEHNRTIQWLLIIVDTTNKLASLSVTPQYDKLISQGVIIQTQPIRRPTTDTIEPSIYMNRIRDVSYLEGLFQRLSLNEKLKLRLQRCIETKT